MRLRRIGHSCFVIDDQLVTDPYGDGIGLPVPHLSASIVTISHNHFDHNNAQAIGGNPLVLAGDVDTQIGNMRIRTVLSCHDEQGGKLRGQNRIFVIETPECTLCHMGDIGQRCTPALAKAIGHVDVLLIPVGGTYTVDAKGAKAYCDALAPTYIVPMHYKTADCTLDIASVDGFVHLFDAYQIIRLQGEVELSSFESDTKVLLFA